ncbi:MAG TPA: D-arabinono-1,4-lactone oxidase [Actinomycetales bacterium]|nr:D-arabinono-1,4-lactone oxidase [Actinomycetales bacterium]
MLRLTRGGPRPGAGAWTNWAGTATATPLQVAHPRDEAELAAVVAAAAARGLRVKPVGSGHSFTPVAVTDGVQVRLDLLSGIERIDHPDADTHLVRVRAGTPLHRLNPLLADAGLAMTNLGDIDRQTISGAVATGTHGTGARFGGLATQVVGLRVVLADGSVVECSEDREPELFAAARLGLGALGVVTELTLQCVPAFRLHADERPMPLQHVLQNLDELADGNDHFEFYWFPHTTRTLTKRNNRLPGSAPVKRLPRWRSWVDDELLSNGVFELTNRLSSRVPAAVPIVNEVTSRALSARELTCASYDVFVSSRRVRFREMEYAVPREALRHLLTELRRLVAGSSFTLPFPVEIRFAAADDVWLSTAYGRETAYVAVHQYHRLDHHEYFQAFEQIACAAGGRPHWGKLHGLAEKQLRELYPRFDDFIAVRDRLDPHRVFGNDYLTRVLGS